MKMAHYHYLAKKLAIYHYFENMQGYITFLKLEFAVKLKFFWKYVLQIFRTNSSTIKKFQN